MFEKIVEFAIKFDQTLRIMQSIFEKIRVFNVWDGKFHNTGYERSEYLNTITKYLGNKLIKLDVGQRRVGKTLYIQVCHQLNETKTIDGNSVIYC